MKKIFFIFVGVIGVMFAACDKNEVNERKQYSEEEILDAVRFVGQGVLPNSTSADGLLKIITDINTENVTVTIRIARKSRGCARGFGLCDPKIVRNFEINPSYVSNDYIYLPYSEVNWNNIELHLAEIPDIDMSDVVFAIDEDVIIEDLDGKNIATIYANEYQYNSLVGNKGGFRLESETIE